MPTEPGSGFSVVSAVSAAPLTSNVPDFRVILWNLSSSPPLMRRTILCVPTSEAES